MVLRMSQKTHCCDFSYVAVQLLSHVRLFATPWTAAHFPGLHHLLELAQTHVRWVNDAIQISRPLLSPFSPALNLSQLRVFSSELTLHITWPKYWSLSFSISPSNEYSGLNSYRIDWFDLLAVQGTLKNLLQHHSSKASILWMLFFLILFIFDATHGLSLVAVRRLLTAVTSSGF